MEEPVLTRLLAVFCVAALLQACASQPPLPASAPLPAPSAASPPEPRPAAQPADAPDPKPIALAQLPAFEGKREVLPPRAPVALVDGTAGEIDDLWQHVRDGFAMPELDNAYVRRQTAYYAKNPEYLQRMLQRSRLYLYYIVREVERRGLPTELALLPMVESAFNPMAYSRAHASGLWQFIPGTGKRFELDQDWWYDERRDVIDSTDAALEYLAKLHDMFDDWHLALAAYNWGENGVARAIARNRRAKKPADYAHLAMPRETRWYVPKLQALKNIVRDPERYGVKLEPIVNQPYFVTLADTPDIDLQLAARLAEMPVEEFIALNPGFSRPFIRSASQPRLVLPAEKVPLFFENLEKHEGRPLVSWKVYRPKPGEKFASIARKFGMTIAELKKVNGVPSGSWRMPKTLVVPTSVAAREAVLLPVMYRPPFPAQGRLRAVHRVRKGDTLAAIAHRYHVSVASLKRWNRVGKYLRVGQRIYIRGAAY